METGLVTGSLFQVPNQSILFPSDPLKKHRSEDDLVAFSWAKYLNNTDKPEWIIFLPMVKSAVRAMDTIEEFIGTGIADTDFKSGTYQGNIKKWAVSGASKRGWATWLTAAAVPDRVMAMIPIVFDLLNFTSNVHHMFRNYGGWTWVMEPYVKENIMFKLDSPEMVEWNKISDPYAYLPRLTMPKLVVNTGMDEFFMPDDTHWWWKDLPEPKHFLMNPNTDHICATGVGVMIPAIGAFVKTVLNDNLAPEFTWTIDTAGTGNIVVNTTSEAPHSVYMWHATTCNGDRRDFRAVNLDSPCSCGIAVKGHCVNTKAIWHKTKLTEAAGQPGIYVAHQDAPTVGWTAFFVDIEFGIPKKSMEGKGVVESKLGVGTWPIDLPAHLEFTSEVSIVPNTFPFPDCKGEDCQGHLV